MKKIITQEQIESVMKSVLSTNITWLNGEALGKFFRDLPSVESEKQPEPPSPDGKQ